MPVLITGGAGYIGSHFAHLLAAKGIKTAVADNLGKGHIQAAPDGMKFYRADICGELDGIFEAEKPDAVVHFAALSLVAESMRDPGAYFRNNIGGTVSLMEACARHNVKHVIFSSSAAVYGQPDAVPITEDCEKKPANPYGESKLAVENILKWYASAYGIKYAALRYFNVAGAMPGGDIGEDHRPETHLVPIVLKSILNSSPVNVFGTDHATPDGTCVRDYIHVCDIADAHLLALDYLRDGGEPGAFNLGLGFGFSVREIIKAAEKVTGKKCDVHDAPRREGDPAALIASGKRAEKRLCWKPKFTSVEDIIRTAWVWHSRHPDGYR